MIVCAASNNAGKLKELRRILERMGHEVKSLRELGIDLDPEETGTTFAENARIKAEAFCKASGLPTIADDSGLCVDALDGAPGVYSARYCGHHGDDEANNDKLLEKMKDVPAGQRGAKFVAAVCFILPTGQHLTCRGECPGRVAFERLAEIREVVTVPLVLHGASDVPDEDVRRTIELGVCKVNVATELKIAFSDAVKAWFAENPQGNDPRFYMRVGMDAMKEVVRSKITVCGSANRLLLPAEA